jgi:ATP-dependent Clp protease ATP-binding subunit ClpB
MDENSKLGKLLLGQGVSKKALENAINNLRGGEAVNDANPKSRARRWTSTPST